MEPADHAVFFRYADRPGIVGVIGTALGERGVNIATMQVARREAGGEALLAMTVDSALTPGTVDDVARAIGAADVRTLDIA